MQILFNDQPMQCVAELTVHELLEQLEQQQAGAALAINQQIVRGNNGRNISCRMATRSCFSSYCRG